ncbi:peptidase M48 family protein [Hydrogenophaga sp. RAC07]|mgnify:CR=1 FL=1|uniref:M48 family metalloprotease n=1 Tax=Hydrogenophaga sp. RAC07 TaxID=1842537 RepID=UPI00085769F1|nr:M48 family metalloprotease [Hydrogenophaga sp. RAC07]AOF87241.1 peptidase M48 family protein [Hydrogenophaga sp. RAC07]
MRFTPLSALIKTSPSVRRPVPWACAVVVAASALLPVSLSSAQVVSDPANTSALPSLGGGEGISISAERRLGDRIARSIYQDPDYLDDPLLVDYLQALWQPLLGSARARGDVPPELAERMAWELMISRERTVNAFALPGGYLGVNLGLLAVTERPEEVASVLAHELSHVSQRHIARLMSREERMAPWMMGAMILGALAAGSNAQVASAAIAGGTAAAAQTQLNFSRDMEREADRVGFGVLSGAGFDAQGFVSMFDKLQQASRLNDDGSFPYLRSHPLSGERIADMRARLPQGPMATQAPAANLVASPAPAPSILNLDLPGVRPGTAAAPVAAGRPGPSVELHTLMSSRARVLAENGPDRMRSWLQVGQGPTARPGERYAAALSALRLGQRDKALELAQKLRDTVAPDARFAADALMLELLLSPSTSPATPAQTALLAELRDRSLAGASRAAVMLGAQAAIASGQPQRAVSRLQSWVVLQSRDALAWQTLARAYQVQGQPLRAVRAEAEARVAHLDYSGAVDRFRAAQSLPVAERSADSMEMAIVDSRRRDVEVLLRESVREEEDSKR